MIRPATIDDLDRLADMGAAILARTPIGAVLQPTPAQVRAYCETVLEAGVAFVAEAPDGHLVGMIGVTLHQHPLGLVYADEVAWWVDEDCRWGLDGPRLLVAVEEWATMCGATHLRMAAPASYPKMGAYLQASGYEVIETVLLKELGDGRRASLQDARFATAPAAEAIASPAAEYPQGSTDTHEAHARAR